MLKWIDRICAAFLLLGLFGHSYGSYLAYRDQPVTLVWALSGSCLVGLVGSLNMARTFRPGDRMLAWFCAAGALMWGTISVGFGLAMGNVFDAKVVAFAIACLILIFSSLRTGIGPREG